MKRMWPYSGRSVPREGNLEQEEEVEVLELLMMLEEVVVLISEVLIKEMANSV